MKGIISTLFTIAIALSIATTASSQNFLEEEAGICAYLKSEQPIDLAKARELALFRAPEQQNEEYLIGSVAIAGYDEAEDAHVYVHKDGWIAAYYLKTDPVAKILDLKNFDGQKIRGTKLDLALSTTADALNVPVTELKYYDFDAPDANRLMLVVDREDNNTTDSFKITIPNTLLVRERSWGHFALNVNPSTLQINGEVIHRFSAVDVTGAVAYGKLSINQLRPGETHTVETVHGRWSLGGASWSTSGLAIVYTQP